jgi:hypothetical protein
VGRLRWARSRWGASRGARSRGCRRRWTRPRRSASKAAGRDRGPAVLTPTQNGEPCYSRALGFGRSRHAPTRNGEPCFSRALGFWAVAPRADSKRGTLLQQGARVLGGRATRRLRTGNPATAGRSGSGRAHLALAPSLRKCRILRERSTITIQLVKDGRSHLIRTPDAVACAGAYTGVPHAE